ncbi:ATP-binding cassette domain-containing protein [Streptomyces sp. MMS24-I2-30]|uniref:ATP-binding cassette domain-containing protein n=1 Tax=Streptomyces sp. MMS24-I2-30 TaxID=3351564 RepID=UPI003896D6AE
MIQAFGLTSNPRKAHPPAVDDVSFEAHAGRVTALLGAPRAGKTTALRLMLELQHGRGITHFRGRPLHQISYPSREVGVLLGDVPGHPARSVRGHLRMLCAAAGVPARRADEVLEVVGLVSLREERLGTLSRGMDRRLGLACALLPDPHTLVLDAPADGLSAREARWLHDMLRAHAAQGGTVLFSTAEPKEAARNADRVVTLDHGRLVADQEATEFARTRLRPRVAVRTPHAARLAALLVKEARTDRRSVEVVREEGNRLSVYGSSTADIGDAAFRHGILVHQLADEVGDMGPGAGTRAADGERPAAMTGELGVPLLTDERPGGPQSEDGPPGDDQGRGPANPDPEEVRLQPGHGGSVLKRPWAGHEAAPATEPHPADEPLPASAPSVVMSRDLPGFPVAEDARIDADGHLDPDGRLLSGVKPAVLTAEVPGTPGTGPTPPLVAQAPDAAHTASLRAADSSTPDLPGMPGTRAHADSSPSPDGSLTADALSALPPPISVRPAPSPLRPLRYELRRATGIGTGFLTCGAVLALSALMAVLLARIGHTPQARLFAAWPREVPLPPAALGAGLLGALAFGDEFRHPALAADRGSVPRRLGLLTAKLLVSGATALALGFLTVGCDAEVLYVVYGRELAEVPADWLSLGASWFGLVIGCAWAGVLAAGIFRSTTAGLAAVLAVPVVVVPLVQKALAGPTVRTAADFPVRMREVLLLQWPFGGERYLAAAARVLVQPVGGALTLSLTALLCAYLLATLRSRVR